MRYHGYGMWPFDTLSRYIARAFAGWFLAFLSLLASIVFIADLLELLRRTASRPQVTLDRVLEMAAMKLPHMVQELLAFAVLFAGIMAFWRLTRTQELVVARSVGVSVWQFIGPAVLVALVVGALKVTAFNPIAAATQQRFLMMENRDIRGHAQTQLALGQGGLWLRQARDGGHAIIHARQVNADLTMLTPFMALLYRADGGFEARIDSPGARLDGDAWLLARPTLTPVGESPRPLEDGHRIATTFTAQKIQDSLARPETMSFWVMPSYIELLESAGFSALRHRIYLQSLLASPLLLAAMVVIAATFSLRPTRRGGVGRMIATGVGTGFLLYLASDLLLALGLSARLPAVLAAWAPAGVSTLLASALLLHLEDG
jgi:lipopolysaccharide export system permease protein